MAPPEAAAGSGLGELFRALGSLVEPPTPSARRVAELLDLGPLPAEADFTDLFLFQLTPYASVYLGAEGMLGGEARDRIAGFWRALQEEAPSEPDHLAVMLAFYAGLTAEEAGCRETRTREALHRARKAFLWEHLLSWLPPYLAKVADLAPPFYRGWARLLENTLREEVAALGPQERLSLHLRETTGITDPRRHDAEGFLSSLLSPVRSGIILTRSDLARAGRKLNLATRAGERSFALEGLLEQDAARTLDWLRREAVGWSRRHRLPDPLAPPVADFWRMRAEATADLLAELAAESALEPGLGVRGGAPAE